MGGYLAHPVRTKESTHGIAGPFQWAASSMQGWRLRMEDAHVTGAPLSLADTKSFLFAVFDGHGGREVAKFSELHIAETLERQRSSIEKALVTTFHELDEQMRDPENAAAISKWREQEEGDQKQGRGAVRMLQASIDADLASAKDRGNFSREEARAVMMKMMVLKRLENARPVEGAAAESEAASASEETAEDAPSSGVNETPTTNANHVGCTAVACVLYPPPHARVVVANAGDSRCVLSRHGKAVELSFDHKPNHDIERARIVAAGGSVEEIVNPIRTHYRVNGNLNLSRALGDFEYKQRADLPPEDQVICATPDIITETITPDDEFIVVACDGIWDIMSSQECVDFIRKALVDLEKTSRSPVLNDLEKIVEDVLDHCITDDPKSTQGLGADNMTCIIVMLKSAETICDP